jgi:hypothetical protein
MFDKIDSDVFSLSPQGFINQIGNAGDFIDVIGFF